MLIVFFIILTFSFASNVFTGQIVDSDTNLPLSNVNIQIEEKVGTVSDDLGFFLFSDISSGGYQIKVSHIGYIPFLTTIVLPDDNKIIIKMKNSSIPYDRIVVTGNRMQRHIKDTPVLTHVVSSNDIENSSYADIKDILGIILPNVQNVASNHNDDKVKMQGLDNKYMTFLVDGDKVSGEYAGNIDFSMLSLDNVAKIEIVEGGMSTLYGSGAIGGVINILTKKNKSPYWFNINYLHDDPLVFSKSLNAGFNKVIPFNNSNISYEIGFINKSSDGYDLTPQSIFSKTLEENFNKSIRHSLTYQFDSNTNIKLEHKIYDSEVTSYMQQFIMPIGNVVLKNFQQSYYSDNSYKVKINHKLSEESGIKFVFNNEEYVKYFYYPYYYETLPLTSIPNENGAQFRQGLMAKKEFIAQYNIDSFLVGFEYSLDSYSSYNIYDNLGNISIESIFDGMNDKKEYIQNSIFFNDTFHFDNDNEINLGLRITPKEEIFYSLSYLERQMSDYNVRFSYSKGYRLPSLKELYYEWIDHVPNIFGNPNLKASTNKYYSISFDKRTFMNDFSVNFYLNKIKNMITTEYQNGNLYYINYNRFVVSGINMHYSRMISDNSTIKFVYNLTNVHFKSDEISEGISRHAFRINFIQDLYKEKFKMIFTANYCSEKDNYDQELFYLKVLESYWISDLIFSAKIMKLINLKFGVKNIFDYRDGSRFDVINSNVLSSYDPGKRYFFEFNLKFNKKG